MSTTLPPPPPPPTEQRGTLAEPPLVGVAGPKRRRERLLSLDVFRGLTVAGMLLVNDPGTWSAIYPPLEHAPWHGWTPTDLIFPFFLFIVGITTHLSLSGRRARGDDDLAADFSPSPAVRRPGTPVTRDYAFAPENESQDAPIIAVGARVRHRKFGAGTIAEVTGTGRDVKAKVDFDDEAVGRKTLVVAQANLEREIGA